jgi:hypothetical protein
MSTSAALLSLAARSWPAAEIARVGILSVTVMGSNAPKT